jgi:hypothetical protein
MTTLKDLFEGGDFGAGQNKTASVATRSDLSGMDQLAMQLGLYGDITKEASFEDMKKKEDDKEEEKEDDKHEEKKASSNLGGLHALLFPDSAIGNTAEKTAMSKQAAAEFAEGERAYDQFQSSFDRFIEKFASEAMSGHPLAGNPHGDSRPVNHLPDNKAKDAKESINTTPHVTDEVKKMNDERSVGHYEQMHTSKTASAFRKHILLSALEG